VQLVEFLPAGVKQVVPFGRATDRFEKPATSSMYPFDGDRAVIWFAACKHSTQ